MKSVLALSILLLVIPAWAQKPPRPYVDSQLGITYTPPAGWRTEPPGGKMTSVQVMYSGPSYDNVVPFIGWGASPAEVKELSEEVVENKLSSHFRKSYPDFQVTGTARIRVGGTDAVSVAGACRIQGVPARMREIFVLHHGYLFTFMFAAGEEGFPRIVGVFEKMMNSVRFTREAVAETPPEVPRTFVHRQLGITYTQPAGWRPTDPERASQMLVAYSGPIRKRTVPRIQWGYLPAPSRTLDRFPPETAGILEDLSRKAHPDFTITASTRTRIGGRNALSLDGSYTYNGVSVRNRQVIVLHPDRMFLFICFAEASEFPEVVADFDRMISSVRFTTPGSR